MIPGANTNSVKTMRIFNELTKSLGSFGAVIEISIFGTTGSAPKRATAKRSMIATAFKISNLLIFGHQEYFF